MKDQFNIEELFRTKLEGAENQPSAAVWNKTARMLRRRQFMKFNASRFNVYYAAALLLLGGALTFTLLSEEAESLEVRVESLESNETTIIEKSFEEQVEKGISTEKKTAEQPERQNEVQKEAVAVVKPGINHEKAVEPHAQSDKSEIMAAEENLSGPVSTMVAFFTVSTLEGCAPLTVKFNNASINVKEILWNFGDVSKPSSLNAPLVIFEEPGAYPVTLTATDPNGLQLTYSEKITVHPQPIAEFEIVDEHLYNYTSGAVEYEWFMVNVAKRDTVLFSTEFQPINHLVSREFRGEGLESVTVLLIVKNIHGCTDTAEHVLPDQKAPELIFPNAFSPDPNGPNGGYYNPNEPNNQVFHPKYSEKPASYTLKIFNKAGERIFETDEIETGWDGYYKESPAPRGVYIYQCTGTWKSGEPYTYRGDITILLSEN